MVTLTEWLLEQIAEDERSVASGEHLPPLNSMVLPVTEYGRESIGLERSRWLAECDAKRRIVEIHKIGLDPCDAHDGVTLESVPCDTMRALALPYADRDGYQEAWRP
ncbi:MAG TPA: DUF6221 family protein [Acidothermaceae bacterium]